MAFEPITLPGSGEVVLVQSVSPFLTNKLRREYPAPKPPVQRVMIGDREEGIANESDPSYIADREKWGRELEEKIRRFAIRMGARIEWTDEKRARLKELRESVQMVNEETGSNIVIEEDDDFAYITYIAFQTTKDVEVLLKAIMEGSRPTEGAIQDAIATFRPEPNGQRTDLQGQEHL
jgi:hypothetical protein